MRIIYADRYQPERMVIGIRGESDTTRVYFDSPERETAAALLVKRRTDSESYGVELKRENGWLIWDVSLMDTSVDGLVKAELTWIKDTEVRKKEYVFHVERSQEKPIIDKRDPKVEYLSKVMGAAQEALEQKAEIKEAAEEAKQAAADANEIADLADQYRAITEHEASAAGQYAYEARIEKEDAVAAARMADKSREDAEAAAEGIEEKLTRAAGYAQTAGEKAAEAGRTLDQVMYTRDQVGRFQDGAQYFYEETKKLHDQDNDEYADLKEDVKNLIGAVEKHDDDIEDLKEKEADNEAAIEAQKQLVLRQEQRVAEVEVRVSNVARTVDTNQGRINALENDLVNHKSTFDNFKAETAGKFTAVNEKIEDLEAMRDEILAGGAGSGGSATKYYSETIRTTASGEGSPHVEISTKEAHDDTTYSEITADKLDGTTVFHKTELTDSNDKHYSVSGLVKISEEPNATDDSTYYMDAGRTVSKIAINTSETNIFDDYLDAEVSANGYVNVKPTSIESITAIIPSDGGDPVSIGGSTVNPMNVRHFTYSQYPTEVDGQGASDVYVSTIDIVEGAGVSIASETLTEDSDGNIVSFDGMSVLDVTPNGIDGVAQTGEWDNGMSSHMFLDTNQIVITHDESRLDPESDTEHMSHSLSMRMDDNGIEYLNTYTLDANTKYEHVMRSNHEGLTYGYETFDDDGTSHTTSVALDKEGLKVNGSIVPTVDSLPDIIANILESVEEMEF